MAHQRIEMGAVLLAMMTVLWARAAAQSSSSCTSAIISMAPCLNYINGNSATPSSGCCTQLANVVRTQPQCLCQVLNGGGTSLGIKVNQTQALALPGACNVQTPPTSRCNAASPSAPPASPSAPAASPSAPAASPVTPAASPAKPASPSVPAASPAKSASLSAPAASPAKPASPSAPAASPAMPAASPTESPAGTPESPNTTSSGTGSKTAPSTQSSISDASATRMTISLLFFSLFVASYASTSRIC